jgi:tetratricopeptide (TPR) repeat protein
LPEIEGFGVGLVGQQAILGTVGDESMEAHELIERFEAALRKIEDADYSAALAEFEILESLSEHPSDIAQLRLYQASCLTDMGENSAARKRIWTVDKNQLEFIVQIGYEYEYARITRADGNLQAALDLSRNALKLIEDDAGSRSSILAMNLSTLSGILLAETGKCDEAILLLKRVPLEDLGWAEATLKLGDCNYKKRLYGEAIKNYEDVISRGKAVHPIWLNAAIRNTGLAFYDLHEYAKAVDCLTLVKDRYEDYPALKNEVLEILASAHTKLKESQNLERHVSSCSRLLQ